MWVCLANLIRNKRTATEFDVVSIFQDGGHTVTNLLPFRIWLSLVSGGGKAICTPDFDQIPQSTADIFLLPVPKSKRSPYWNFTSGLNFMCHRHVILDWTTKLYANWMIAGGVMTSYWFYKMPSIASQIYFRFLVWRRLTFKKV